MVQPHCDAHLPGIIVDTFIVIVAGFIGGIRNWLTEPSSINISERRRLCARLTDGVVASATVPLFLSIVGNEKINASLGEIRILEADYQQSILILVGFCVLAAVYSQKFLETLSSKFLNELKSEVEKVQLKGRESAVVIDALNERDIANSSSAKEVASIAESLDDNSMSIINALANRNFILRSEAGLRGSTGLSSAEIEKNLRRLIEAGYVDTLETEKGRRWFLTDIGRLTATT